MHWQDGLYTSAVCTNIAHPGGVGACRCGPERRKLALPALAQALSKRIHYGKFVAEAKFRAKPQEYAALIRQKDTDGLMALLTDEVQEAKVLPREILFPQTAN